MAQKDNKLILYKDIEGQVKRQLVKKGSGCLEIPNYHSTWCYRRKLTKAKKPEFENLASKLFAAYS